MQYSALRRFTVKPVGSNWVSSGHRKALTLLRYFRPALFAFRLSVLPDCDYSRLRQNPLANPYYTDSLMNEGW